MAPAAPRPRAWIPWSLAAVAILAAAALGTIALTRPAPPPPRMVRFEVNNPEGAISIGAPRVSPDGRYLAFNATDAAGVTRIWVRQMNALTAQPLPGTDGASRPVLVAGQQVPRLHGAGKTDEDRCVGRTGTEDLRRAERIGWQLEPGRGHPVRRPRQRSHLPRAGVGRHAGACGETRPRRARIGSSDGPSSSPTDATSYTWRRTRSSRTAPIASANSTPRSRSRSRPRRPCSRMRRPATCCSCAIRRWWRSRSMQRQ